MNVKFEEFTWTRSKGGDTLLSLTFKDDRGNSCEWFPCWEEVEGLICRVLAVEAKNEAKRGGVGLGVFKWGRFLMRMSEMAGALEESLAVDAPSVPVPFPEPE